MRQDISTAPIAVGGGAPMIYRAVNAGGRHRVVIATHEAVVKSHLIGPASIASVDALRGKRIGYSGTGTVTHVGLLSFVRKMGWDPERDVTLVERASSPNAVTEGKVDAAMASAMLVALAPARGLREIVDLTQYDFPLAGSGIMAERAWLAANREAAVRFVKAAVDAVALMKRDRGVVNASRVRWFNITGAAPRSSPTPASSRSWIGPVTSTQPAAEAAPIRGEAKEKAAVVGAAKELTPEAGRAYNPDNFSGAADRPPGAPAGLAEQTTTDTPARRAPAEMEGT